MGKLYLIMPAALLIVSLGLWLCNCSLERQSCVIAENAADIKSAMMEIGQLRAKSLANRAEIIKRQDKEPGCETDLVLIREQLLRGLHHD